MRLGSTCDSAGLFMCLQASVYVLDNRSRPLSDAITHDVVRSSVSQVFKVFYHQGCDPPAHIIATDARTALPETARLPPERSRHRCCLSAELRTTYWPRSYTRPQ